ncbi:MULTISPECIES: hypothetical protein [unclassified Microbacterium]|uniref:hypothetical protein n=1 Tax=unclassified Microbacterium TaxID=2609290 RepID=UPI003655B350
MADREAVMIEDGIPEQLRFCPHRIGRDDACAKPFGHEPPHEPLVLTETEWAHRNPRNAQHARRRPQHFARGELLAGGALCAVVLGAIVGIALAVHR